MTLPGQIYYPPNTAFSIADKSGNNQFVGINKFGAGGNYTQFDANGHQTMVGNATVFDDLLGDITKLKVVGVGIADDTAENAINFQSSANLSDYVYTNYQQSHKRKQLSAIFPHIHYEQIASATPNFLLEYRWQVNGGAKTTVWTRLICKTQAFTYVSGTLNQIAYSAGITPASDSISDILEIRFFRDNANTSGLFSGADTAGTNILVTSADVHYEIDSVGSNTEYSK